MIFILIFCVRTSSNFDRISPLILLAVSLRPIFFVRNSPLSEIFLQKFHSRNKFRLSKCYHPSFTLTTVPLQNLIIKPSAPYMEYLSPVSRRVGVDMGTRVKMLTKNALKFVCRLKTMENIKIKWLKVHKLLHVFCFFESRL